ncbi:hypothetical protein [Lignipirellula cremea]|uniref:LTXXQ motif protein n=1 Tax=Lignipirellula cremea TaxID=2528010 RepID=A0A518DR64_9BACT|nr:hypothetical protein [Lignipirellula cremea]QDU94327.1 hypothetical protein Pla8534_21160 [Lignipirellula cremea]
MISNPSIGIPLPWPTAACRAARPLLFAVVACATVLLAGADHAVSPEPNDQQRLLAMSAADKAKLAKQKERFEQLPAEEQERIRTLYRQVSQHPDRERLVEVMQRYTDWLADLTSSQRAELRGLSSTARIGQIEQFKLTQAVTQLAASGSSELQADDISKMHRWLEGYTRTHRDAFLNQLPADVRDRVSESPAEIQTRMLLFGAARQPSFRFPTPATEEVVQLEAELSPAAQGVLEQATTPQLKVEIVNSMLKASFSSRWESIVSEDDLQKYAAELPREKQEELESLTREEMHRRLRQMYFASRARHHASRWPFWKGGPPRRDDHEPGEHGPRTGPPRGPGGGPPHGPDDLGPGGMGPGLGPRPGSGPWGDGGRGGRRRGFGEDRDPKPDTRFGGRPESPLDDPSDNP